MKKILILISLITILSSCGGGGGGGASGQHTGGSTPIIGNSGNHNNNSGTENVGKTLVPGGSTGGIINNNSGSGNVGNKSIAPGGSTPPLSGNNFPKPSDNRAVIGSGVKVGVLDSDFLSGSGAETTHFHTRLNGGFLEGSKFDDVINKEFGSRMHAIPKTNGAPSGNDHGLIVASILAGNNGTGAKGADVYGVSLANGAAIGIDIGYYRDLYNKNVRIFNQSFGSENVVFNTINKHQYKEKFKESLYTPTGLYTPQQLLDRSEEVINFYENAIENGALFVWAGGNQENPGVNFEAGLPYFNPRLQKGWIAALGVTVDSNGEINGKRYAYAGEAAYWSVAADARCGLPDCRGDGSSYSAPKVTAVAAKLKEKFPWMTGHEIQQTILTSADMVYDSMDADGRVSTKYGWGLLNSERALKGPVVFDNVLLEGKERATLHGVKGQFLANIPHGMTSIFENDIRGDGGLKKTGKGTLVLTGNSIYEHNTDIEDGALEIYGYNGSNINIKQNGRLVTYPEAMIGGKDYYGNISEEVQYKKNVTNDGGTFENRGKGAVISGNYTASNGAVTKADFGTSITVKGNVELNGNNTLKQTLSSGRYITAKGISAPVIQSEEGIKGNFTDVETPELIKGSTEVKGNEIVSTLSRKDVSEYVSGLSLADEMKKDVAENIEASFRALDAELEKGNSEAVQKFALSAAKIQSQSLSLPTSQAVLDSLSGQIYGSAQALTFQHSQTVNRDLSNRLVMLGTLENVGSNAGLWVTGIGASGKLKQDGFGTGKTKVAGGQVGIDRQFTDSLILGTALSYSKSDVKFDRYGGESKADQFGISLYGRLGSKEQPYYLQGRLGLGFVDSNVERDIMLSATDTSRAKISHRDKVLSGYLEAGYDVRSGSFVLTPFVGLAHDSVKRGAFSEKNSQFGLTAGSRRYDQTSGLVGIRVGYGVDWHNGSRSTFQGYVNHQRAFKEQDLSFEAAYTGLSNAKFTVKGIGLAKNSTWIGAGVLTEVNPNFSWYVNYDGKIDSKGRNNVYTTGFRFNF